MDLVEGAGMENNNKADISNVVKIIHDGMEGKYKKLKCSGIDSASGFYEFNRVGKSYSTIRAVSSLVHTLKEQKYKVIIDEVTSIDIEEYTAEQRQRALDMINL